MSQDFIYNFLANIERLAAHILERNFYNNRPFTMTQSSLCVLDGLAARQASLLFQFTRNIALWNPHGAPVLLRSMIECYITLKWIAIDPVPRSKQYFNYGIGQARQFADVYGDLLEQYPDNADLKWMRDFNREYAASFKHLAFVDVNLGSWSGLDIRSLSKEIGEEQLYKTAFAQFSSATHNTFYHVGSNNLRPCKNQAHPSHLVATMDDGVIYPDFLYRACKYFDLLDNAHRGLTGGSSRIKTLSHYYYRNEAKIIDYLSSKI